MTNPRSIEELDRRCRERPSLNLPFLHRMGIEAARTVDELERVIDVYAPLTADARQVFDQLEADSYPVPYWPDFRAFLDLDRKRSLTTEETAAFDRFMLRFGPIVYPDLLSKLLVIAGWNNYTPAQAYTFLRGAGILVPADDGMTLTLTRDLFGLVPEAGAHA